jgi:iron complex transport system ATP-binding protein
MNTTGQLRAEQLSAGYESRVVIAELSLTLPPGKMTAIVGANGSGKSTLLKAFARILKPLAGAAYLDGDAIHATPTRELARRLSILPQGSQAPEALTVGELVSYGRYPHRRWLSVLDEEDRRIVAWALDATRMTDLEHRSVNALSGGQQQRAWIAMTLAQGAHTLLLDEPTSHLDACHQLEAMELLAELNRDAGKTVVLVLHDLNLAARYGDHMIAMKNGGVVAAGAPATVMTPETLLEVFGIAADILCDPRTGRPICIPYLSGAKKPE